jgi:hypothetical protein
VVLLLLLLVVLVEGDAVRLGLPHDMPWWLPAQQEAFEVKAAENNETKAARCCPCDVLVDNVPACPVICSADVA